MTLHINKFFTFFLKRNTFKAATLLSLLLVSPALFSGFFADDLYFIHRLSGGDLMPAKPNFSPFGLFALTPGGAEANHGMIEKGLLPWWTPDSFRFQMFRPLAELSFALDYKLFGANPIPMHFENLLWWAAVLFAVYTIYRKLFPDNIQFALVCFILYALDGSIAQTITWVVARNTLMAMFFSLAAFLFAMELKNNERNELLPIFFAPLLFIAALASSEFAIGILPFIFLFCIFEVKKPLFKKALILSPYVFILLVWAYIYKTNNYGVFGSAQYIDPNAEPVRFLMALTERLPIYTFRQFMIFQPQLLGEYHFLNWLWIFSILVIAGFLVLAKDYVKTRIGLWLTVASLCAIVPMSGSTGGPRLIGFVALGITPILAAFIVKCLNDLVPNTYLRFAGYLSFVLHCLSMLAFLVVPILMAFNANYLINKPAASLPILPGKTVVLLNPTQAAYSVLFPVLRANEHLIAPTSALIAMTGDKEIQFIRKSALEFDLVPEKKVLTSLADFFFRPQELPFLDNAEYDFSNYKIVTHVHDNELRSITLVLKNSIDTYQFVGCDNKSWVNIDATTQSIGASSKLASCNMQLLKVN